MNRLRILPIAALALLVAACGRANVLVTPAQTRVVRPTTVALVATEAPAAGDATAEAVAPAEPAGPQPTTVALGDAERGAALFVTTYTTAQGPWACSLCHNVNEVRLVGPGLGGLRVRFEDYEVAEPIENYVHTAIVNPNAFISPADAGGAYPPNLMPQNYAELLTEQDLSDLAAYILTLS